MAGLGDHTGTTDLGDGTLAYEERGQATPHAGWISIDDSGHQVNAEQPARFDELLGEFLHTC